MSLAFRGTNPSPDPITVPRRYAVHIDGHATPHLLDGEEALHHLIHGVADVCKMRVLQTLCSRIDHDIPSGQREADETGLSVQALISTSHIAIHTWPAVGFFMFDLVSCRPFDEQAVYAQLEERLGMHSVVQNYCDETERKCS